VPVIASSAGVGTIAALGFLKNTENHIPASDASECCAVGSAKKRTTVGTMAIIGD